MANKKITQLTELDATPAGGDKVPFVDISDATDSVNGTTKWVSVDNLVGSVDTLGEVLANGGTATSAALGAVISDETGSGALVFATGPTFVAPQLGIVSGGNFSTGTFTWPTFNQDTTGNAATVTTNANLTGDVTSSGNATSIAAGVIIDADIKSDAAIAYSKLGTIPTFNQDTTGTSATVTGSAQTAITSLGTLTSLGIGKSPAVELDVKMANTGLNGIQLVDWNNRILIGLRGNAATADGEIYINNQAESARIALRADADSYFMDSLGIGTTVPAKTLHIKNTTGVAQLRLDNNGSSSEIYADTNIYMQPNGTSCIRFKDGGDTEFFNTSGVAKMTWDASEASLDLIDSKLKLGGSYGSDGQVLTSTGSGVAWEAVSASATVEGTNVLSTGETAGSLFLREDGDGTSSWQAVAAGTIGIGGAITSGTSGSVLFVDSSGNLAQDNDKLFWDATNFRLGVANSSPQARLEVADNSSSQSILLKVTADDQSQYSLIVGNDTYSATDTDGIGMWINNAGVGKLHARGTGSELRLGTAGVDRVTIDTVGRVGLGTDTFRTGGNLQIKANTSESAYLDIDSYNDLNAGLRLYENDVFKWQLYNDGNSSDVYKIDSASGTAVTVTQAGLVGIAGTPTNANLVVNNSSTSSPVTSMELMGGSIADGGGTGIFLKASTSTTADRFGARINTIREAGGNGAASLVFSTDDSSSLNEALRIDSDGLVGIKTSSPSDYYYNDLVVNSGDEGGLTIVDTTSGQSALAFGDGTTGNERYRGRVLYDHSTDTLQLGAGGLIQAGMTTTGLGVGTTAPTALLNVGGADPRLVIGASTPDAWFTSSYDMGVLQIGNMTLAAPDNQLAANAWGILSVNARMGTDSNWKYGITDEAAMYQISDGTHIFKVAPSGTADATITWIDALTISNDGAFGLSGANYGTSGQVLTSAGSSAVPTWEDAGGSSGVTALSEASSVAIDFSGTKHQTLEYTGTCGTLTSSNLSAGKEVELRIYSNDSVGLTGFAPSIPAWKEIANSISSGGVDATDYGILKLTSWGTTDADVTAELHTTAY